jgi:phosphatidylglycerol---prolipoprotein diacylglyceryl transferase
MRRILFRLGGIPIYSYPAMLYLGLVAGVLAATRVAPTAHLPPARAYTATLVLLVPALAGARLLYVLSNWDTYRREPRRIWRSWEGGASLYGGLLVSLLLSIPLLRTFDLAFWPFWDVTTFTLLIGMALTKIGCLLNGCCSGRETAGLLGMSLADHRGVRLRRIPVQLLESGVALTLLVAVALLWPRRPFDGAVFLGALFGYGIARGPLECLRDTAAVDRLRNVRVNLLISAALAALAAIGLGVLVSR